MKEHRITAVPIINNYERLITTLSSSDARFVTEANIGLITGPALDFLKTCHGIRAPVTAKMTSTIEGVMEQLLESKIHRVWIEEDGKIIGVVSMSNILSLWRSWTVLFNEKCNFFRVNAREPEMLARKFPRHSATRFTRNVYIGHTAKPIGYQKARQYHSVSYPRYRWLEFKRR